MYATMASAEAVSKLPYSPPKRDYSGEHNLNFVFSGVVAPVLCTLGMIGNILAMIVWNRPSMATSTGRYLTAQAVADFFLLLLFLLNDCIQTWEPQFVFGALYGYYFSYVGFPLYFFFVILHVWFTVGISVDLCVMVCCILKAKAFCNTKVANIFILTLAIIGFLINIPHFFNFRPVSETTTTTANTTTNTINIVNSYGYHRNIQNKSEEKTLSFAATDYSRGDGGMFYQFCVHCLGLIAIPWSAIFVMNAKVIFKLVHSNRRMLDKKSIQSAKSSKETETHITRLLLGVTFSFLLFVGINCAVHCIWMMDPPQVDRHLVYSFYTFAKIGMVLNAVSHFFFYCILGRRFRAELCQMVCFKSMKTSKSSSLLLVAKSSQTSDNTVTGKLSR